MDVFMAALLLFLRGVGMVVGGALIWIVFALVPPWLCGFALCRHNAWWTPADRVRAYISIGSERLARLLVPEYIGWNSYIRTPIFFNRYTMNKYPERLSLLGLLNYIVTSVTTLGYWYCVTDFLFLRFIDPNWALWALFALVGEAVVFFALSNWNTAGRRDPAIVITRQGMRQIRAAKRVKRRLRRKGRNVR